MEGAAFFSKCGFGLKNCTAGHPCPLHDEYMIIRDIFYQVTNKTSIQALADKIIAQKAILSRIPIAD